MDVDGQTSLRYSRFLEEVDEVDIKFEEGRLGEIFPGSGPDCTPENRTF
jgi:hypothetical protein